MKSTLITLILVVSVLILGTVLVQVNAERLSLEDRELLSTDANLGRKANVGVNYKDLTARNKGTAEDAKNETGSDESHEDNSNNNIHDGDEFGEDEEGSSSETRNPYPRRYCPLDIQPCPPSIH